MLADEKLSYAVRDLIGVGTIQERLGRAYGPLSVLGQPIIGKLAAFGNREDLVIEFDGIMARFAGRVAAMPDEQAGMLAESILALYQQVASTRE
jgi:hypothetical protein